MPDLAQPTPKPLAHKRPYISNPYLLIKPSWDALKVNPGTLVAAVLIPTAIIITTAAVLGGMTIGLSAIGEGGDLPLILLLGLAVIITLVIYFFSPAITAILLADAEGRNISLPQALLLAPKYGPAILLGSILMILAVMGGFILLIIPGLIFMAWFSLFQYIVLEENLGAVAALGRSKELIRGHLVETWGLIFMISAIDGVLGFIPGVGPIATLLLAIVIMPATAIRYLQLKNLSATNSPAPKAHIANYLVIFVAILVGMYNYNSQKAEKAKIREIQNDKGIKQYEVTPSEDDALNNPY